MPLEVADYVHELNPSYPVGAVDYLSGADDQIRLVKHTLRQTFANFAGALTSSESEIDAVVQGLLVNYKELGALTPEHITNVLAALVSELATVTAADIALLQSLVADDLAKLAAITVSADEINFLSGLAGNVEERFAALEVESSTATFAGWVGGVSGSDNAGAFYTVSQGTAASSGFYALEEVASEISVALKLKASSASTSYTIYLDLYDNTDTLLDTKTVLQVLESEATPALVEITRTLGSLAANNPHTAAIKAKIRVTLNVAATSLDIYGCEISSTAGVGWGTLVAGTAVVLASDTALMNTTVDYVKTIEFRVAGSGTVRTSITIGLQVHLEDIAVSAGDWVQVYTKRVVGLDYARVYVNGVAVGTERTDNDDDLSITFALLVAGTAVDGEF